MGAAAGIHVCDDAVHGTDYLGTSTILAGHGRVEAAKLLGIEELPDVYMASVEFSGMIREDASAGPSPFREVWNMTKPVSGSGGWLVAGVQALQ